MDMLLAIAFSEEAVAKGIPIKVNQKRYTFPPLADVIKTSSGRV